MNEEMLSGAKIDLINWLTTLNDSVIIEKLLAFRKNEIINATGDNVEPVFKPMPVEELDKRIDKSEADFATGKFKESKELLAKYK